MISLHRALLLVAVVCSASPALAQQQPEGATAEPAAAEPAIRAPIGTRVVNTSTPFTTGARRWELLFAHRFRGTLNDGSAHDLWGLDKGSDVTLAAGYGLTGDLDLWLARSSIEEDFEFAAKWRFLAEARGAPISAALRVGVNVLGSKAATDATRPFVQLPLARSIGRRAVLLAVPSWVRDTPRLRNAFNVPVALSFQIGPLTRLEAEYVPKNRDLDASVAAWQVGFGKTVGGHLFKVFLGNSRATTVDQTLGGDSAAGFRRSDLRLGFNLVRYLPH